MALCALQKTMKGSFIMKRIIKSLAFLLCAVLMLGAVCSCSSSFGAPLLSIADNDLSVNTYELMLARMKGTLAAYGYNVESASFWKTTVSSDGMTWDDYFCSAILDEATRYVIADYLFDLNGLILTDEREQYVDSLMDALIKRVGSKTRLNEDLKKYGANYDVLRELYILESKIDMLKDTLYGKDGELIAEEDKERFAEENYVAFGQILLPSYYYLVDTDRFGDSVYYLDEKHSAIAYDKVSGEVMTDDRGNVILDVLGDPEYFTEDGKIAYDRENGHLGYVTMDDGNRAVDYYSDAEMGKKYETAVQYSEACDGDIEKFMEYARLYDEGESLGEKVYLYRSEGFYGSQNDSVAYLDDIAEELSKMEVGECKVVRSDFGCHVICKYETEKGDYANEKYSDTFDTFADNMIETLFTKLCREYEGEVTIHTDVMDKAPGMIDVLPTVLY